MLRRIQIEPYDGLQFRCELKIVADLERSRQMRFQPVLVPDPPHALFAEACGFRHCPSAPVSRVKRFLLRCHPDNVLNFGRRNGRSSSRTRRILFQRGDALIQESVAPTGRLFRRDLQSGGYLSVLQSRIR